MTPTLIVFWNQIFLTHVPLSHRPASPSLDFLWGWIQRTNHYSFSPNVGEVPFYWFTSLTMAILSNPLLAHRPSFPWTQAYTALFWFPWTSTLLSWGLSCFCLFFRDRRVGLNLSPSYQLGGPRHWSTCCVLREGLGHGSLQFRSLRVTWIWTDNLLHIKYKVLA